LFQRYGDNGTFAVVTGGSDGIGLEICQQLAQQGFNICIISRNQAKIDEKLEMIRALYPKVNTLGIAADLGSMTTMEAYHTLVDNHLAEIDIGYLALNAGRGSGLPLNI
jgi:short-subunit dehydrogenase